MKSSLSPKYKKQIGDFVIVWFEKSNNYILLSIDNYSILELFEDSKNKIAFIDKLLSKGFSKQHSLALYSEINALLVSQNTSTPKEILISESSTPKNIKISNSYSLKNVKFSIHYSSEKVKQLIHPSIDYLSDSEYKEYSTQIAVYQENNILVLKQNGKLIFKCLAREYHKLQGKFSLLLMNCIYNTRESDYLACFHASTVSITGKGIMLIGSSGSGKSTLTAILQKEYNLVADDVTYMVKKDLSLKSYPAAISIKDGSVTTLKKYYPGLKNYKTTTLHQSKGPIRYIPPAKPLHYEKPIVCDTIILVNYKANAETLIEPIKVDKVLNVLIPESWISHDLESASKFLNWLNTVKFYKLTYSDSNNISHYLKANLLK